MARETLLDAVSSLMEIISPESLLPSVSLSYCPSVSTEMLCRRRRAPGVMALRRLRRPAVTSDTRRTCIMLQLEDIQIVSLVTHTTLPTVKAGTKFSGQAPRTPGSHSASPSGPLLSGPCAASPGTEPLSRQAHPGAERDPRRRRPGAPTAGGPANPREPERCGAGEAPVPGSAQRGGRRDRDSPGWEVSGGTQGAGRPSTARPPVVTATRQRLSPNFGRYNDRAAAAASPGRAVLRRGAVGAALTYGGDDGAHEVEGAGEVPAGPQGVDADARGHSRLVAPQEGAQLRQADVEDAAEVVQGPVPAELRRRLRRALEGREDGGAGAQLGSSPQHVPRSTCLAAAERGEEWRRNVCLGARSPESRDATETTMMGMSPPYISCPFLHLTGECFNLAGLMDMAKVTFPLSLGVHYAQGKVQACGSGNGAAGQTKLQDRQVYISCIYKSQGQLEKLSEKVVKWQTTLSCHLKIHCMCFTDPGATQFLEISPTSGIEMKPAKLTLTPSG
ncbi:uncharacterized protein LOC113983650 [Pipra filicauda]|uniref:Uncharacterized protein LOC113983650 n=1 Tax=Pipra filicauda TaxID=649802 RepID=A0A7R5KAR8_9PASS|nr:uncharacterized protein LOC113983650 [Pipra filicauda]